MTEPLLVASRRHRARLAERFEGRAFLTGYRLLETRLKADNVCATCERALAAGDVAYCIAGRSWCLRWCPACAAKLDCERVELG